MDRRFRLAPTDEHGSVDPRSAVLRRLDKVYSDHLGGTQPLSFEREYAIPAPDIENPLARPSTRRMACRTMSTIGTISGQPGVHFPGEISIVW